MKSTASTITALFLGLLIVMSIYLYIKRPATQKTYTERETLLQWEEAFPNSYTAPSVLAPTLQEDTSTEGVELVEPKEPNKRERYTVAVQKNLSYGPNPLNKIDLYYPEGVTDAPIIVFVHGGAWRVGKRTQHTEKAEFFASHGYAFATIDYTLWPDADWETQAMEIARAVDRIANNAKRFGGDPDSIFLMGHSAGAHLADIVATDKTYLSSVGRSLDQLNGVIVLDTGGLDMFGVQKYNPEGWIEAYVEIFGDDEEDLRRASPITHVVADAGIPPHFLAYANRREVVYQNTLAMKLALEKAGIDVIRMGFDKNHEEINKDIGKPNDPINEPLLSFLETYK